MRFRICGKVIYVPSVLLVTAVLVIILTVAVIGYIMSQKEENAIITITPEPAMNTQAPEPTQQIVISVHMIGCVKQKQVVRLQKGSTVEDAVAAAGGFTEDADIDAVNLAYRLSDGMQIKIPSVNETDKTWIISPGGNNNENPDSEKVSINTATINELMTLPGIGESLAKKIIDYRTKNNGFKSIEEIMQVPGIKEAKYESLKDYITL